MNKINIAVICGTSRRHRNSIKVAKLITEVGSRLNDIETILVDPRDYLLPLDGNAKEYSDPKYTEITKNADGFLIVVPEYNHSFPGSLKRLLDSERENYFRKAVAFAGVSRGPWGGVRAIESLMVVVRELRLFPTYLDVQFPKVHRLFDKDGNLLDDAFLQRIERTFEELIWLTKTLNHGRDNY